MRTQESIDRCSTHTQTHDQPPGSFNSPFQPITLAGNHSGKVQDIISLSPHRPGLSLNSHGPNTRQRCGGSFNWKNLQNRSEREDREEKSRFNS